MENIIIRLVGVGVMLIAYKVIRGITSNNYNKKKKRNFLKTKKIKGYTCSHRDGYKTIFFWLAIINLSIILFLLCIYILGETGYIESSPEANDNILGIICVFFAAFLPNILFFIYTSKCNLYFNDEEVIKYRLVRKKQIMKINEIEKTLVTPSSRIMIYSQNDKLSFGLDTSESDKFIALLQEKGIEINYK